MAVFVTKRESINALQYTGKNGAECVAFLSTTSAECDERQDVDEKVGKSPFKLTIRGVRMKVPPGFYITVVADTVQMVPPDQFEAKYEPA